MPDGTCIAPDGRGLAFILSAPRAGSTLLAAILGSHTQVQCPPEPWFLLPLVKMLDGDILVVGTYDHTLAFAAIAETARRTILNDAVRAYAQTVYNSQLLTSGKRIFVDKTPRYYQIADRLAELFPKAVQIWLKRNPLDVVASLKSTWGLSIPELSGDHVSPYTFDAILSHTILANHFANTPAATIELKYEDLVAAPGQMVTRICDILDIPFEPSMLEYGRNTQLIDTYKRAHMGDKKILATGTAHTYSVDRWRSTLEPAEVAVCLTALGSDSFAASGYQDAFLQACEYAEVAAHEVPNIGRVAEIRAAYDVYAKQAVLHGDMATRDDSAAGLKYTLLGQQNVILQHEADKRLEVIQRLDADVRVLRERAQVTEALQSVEAAIGNQERALAQLQAVVGGQQDSLREIELSIERHEHALATVQDSTARTRLRGISDPLLAAEVLALERSKEQAEAAAEARLRVIEELELALRRYRRWHPREYIARWTAPRIGQLYQYAARPLDIPQWYLQIPKLTRTPLISIVTPSLNQGRFIERTLRSVLDQHYPSLEYIVQDAASSDETLSVLDRYSHELAHIESVKDSGFANGINLGFQHASGELMAYLNSDDVLLPGSLHYVAKYFIEHPDVDVVYGHRVVVDEYDAEIGRWVLPRHDDEVLSWADYVPQETLFWRTNSWHKIGGTLDESFRFAVDWDLLIRLRDSGATMRRLPRFLGAFRVHPHQKTTTQMEEIGVGEMDRLRQRCHGRAVIPTEINRALRGYLRRHFIYHKLYRLGMLRY
jgi:hypothetical protein